MSKCNIHIGDCREVLKTLPAESVNCVVTSPPYFGLRDYGTGQWVGGKADCEHKPSTTPAKRGLKSSTLAGGKKSTGHQQRGFKQVCLRCGAGRVDSQIGLEPTPDDYVAQMVAVFREIHRVLRKDGVVWLNLGDSYAQTGGTGTQGASGQRANRRHTQTRLLNKMPGLKPKDLIGIPWRVALALQADGWYLRQDIIWHKPNPMPESVTDRCTKAHEYIFLLSKSQKYFYNADAIREPHNGVDDKRNDGTGKKNFYSDQAKYNQADPERQRTKIDAVAFHPLGRNKRSVWSITTKPFADAHFAVFPLELILPCVMAGCPKDGVVLDPFTGSGTTGLAAKKLNRKFIGVELNPTYAAMAQKRIAKAEFQPDLFTEV